MAFIFFFSILSGLAYPFIKKLFVPVATLTIDINFENSQRIAFKRKQALEQEFLFPDPTDFVPAQIRFQNRTMRADVRLKGDACCHWEGDKWSYRIKLKGNDRLYGMKQFSIQHPRERHYLHEWLFHHVLKREGLMGLRYDFIKVIINGENHGIYALEEHFDKYLVENNRRREGPIIKFNEDFLWRDRAWTDLNRTSALQSFYTLNVEAFRKTTTLSDPKRYQEFLTAYNLLESFRNEELSASKVFDTEKLATFFALMDVFGASHSSAWHNMRFYYNPVTSKLEPIGFDAEPGVEITNILGSLTLHAFNFDAHDPFTKLFFKDEVFFKQYLAALERLSKTSYLDELFQNLDDAINNKMTILQGEFKEASFDPGVYYKNQRTVRQLLAPVKSLNAHIQKITPKEIELHIGNIQSFPVEIQSLAIDDKTSIKPQNHVILSARERNQPVKYQKATFVIPAAVNLTEENKTTLKIQYGLLGTSYTQSDEVFVWPSPEEQFLDDDIFRKKANIKQFKFLTIDKNTKKIIFQQGHWDIDKDIIIPNGYRVICGIGTTLNLLNSSKILSYSPISFIGTENNPVIITSSDQSGQGLIVLNAKEESQLAHVYFDGLTYPSQGSWELTGTVTFNESPVKITSCQFKNNKAEDSLNIIRSEFGITESLFAHAQFDAVDIDFGKGYITDSSFVSPGNDAIDLSGSVVHLKNIKVNRAGDKAVSIGEKSIVKAQNVQIRNAQFGLAVKDLSQLHIRDVSITNSQVGLAVYQKKHEFGPAYAALNKVNLQEVQNPLIIEEGSKAEVNGKGKSSDQEKVKEILAKYFIK